MPKDRVAALLASFPKLISTGTQHTTVEDDNVRYVYQPLEELYIVLITNLQSNILQDIDTLHLLSQIVVSSVRSADERDVLANSFEILSAFDEVLSLGYRENLNLSQVTTFLEMESHEEKIHEIIERNKEIEAAEERKLRAKQLEITRNEMAKRSGGSRNLTSFSSASGFGSNSAASSNTASAQSSFRNNNSSPSFASSSPIEEETPKPRAAPPRGKGLQLGKKKPDALHTLRGSISEAETARLIDNVESSSQARAKAQSQQQKATQAPQEPANEGIYISIKEEISAQISRMGAVESADLKGSLQLQIGDPSLTSIQLLVSADGPAGQYRTHPNVDKTSFSQNKTIKVRDPRRPFPGNNQQLSVLRWQVASKGDDELSLVPIEFHCWFSPGSDDSINGVIEYELKDGYEETLENVKIQIPLLSGNVSVSSTDQTWNQYSDEIEWIIPEIVPGSDTSTGSLEWTAEATSEDDFFPMSVGFSVRNPIDTFGKVTLIDVASIDDSNESVPFKKDVIIEASSVSII